MLKDLGVDSVRLMTNNASKIDAMIESQIKVERRVPILTLINPQNKKYLETKAARMGHIWFDNETTDATGVPPEPPSTPLSFRSTAMETGGAAYVEEYKNSKQSREDHRSDS